MGKTDGKACVDLALWKNVDGQEKNWEECTVYQLPTVLKYC